MKLLDLIFAGRPMLHLPIWSIYLISLHHYNRFSKTPYEFSDFYMMGLISLVAVGAYYINQVYDYETDRINNKLGYLQKNLLGKQELVVWSIFLFLVSAIGAYSISVYHFYMILIFISLSLAYSVPPIKLKDRAIGGLITNGFSYGYMVPLAAVDSFRFDINFITSNYLPLYFLHAILAIHVLTTLVDLDGDTATGKKTLATILSRKKALVLSLVLVGYSAFLAFLIRDFILFGVSIISLLTIMPCLFSCRPLLLNIATKLPILLLTLYAGYLFNYYLIFVVVLIVACRIYFKWRFKIVYPKLS